MKPPQHGAIYLVNNAVFGQRFYSVTQPFAYILYFQWYYLFSDLRKTKTGIFLLIYSNYLAVCTSTGRKKTTLRASFNSSTLQKSQLTLKEKCKGPYYFTKWQHFTLIHNIFRASKTRVYILTKYCTNFQFI